MRLSGVFLWGGSLRGKRSVTRPIRPTIRPHDDEMVVRWLWYSPCLTLASTFWNWNSRKFDRMIDGLTDRWKDRLSYKDVHDASRESSKLPLSIVCSKILIYLVFEKGMTNRRTDGRTDGPGYRDARTHLQKENEVKGSIMEWNKIQGYFCAFAFFVSGFKNSKKVVCCGTKSMC